MGKKIMNAIETTPWHTGTRTCTYVRTMVHVCTLHWVGSIDPHGDPPEKN